MGSAERPPYEDEYLYPISDVLDFNADASHAYKTFEPYFELDAEKTSFADNDKYVLKLFHAYLAFATETYVSGNENGALTIGDGAFKPFAQKFARLLNETYDRYQPQLVGYELSAGKLLESIKSTTTSKSSLSEAPQTATIAADNGDDQLANLANATATSADDGGTAIMRLKEIHDAIASVYSEWYHELERIVAIQ